MTDAPDFHAMSDAEFEAHWDKRALDAANHADLTGDDSQVEAVKEAYGDAIFDRHVATDLAIDMANDIARDIAGTDLASIEESAPTENGELIMAIPKGRPTLHEITGMLVQADDILRGANMRGRVALDELTGSQPEEAKSDSSKTTESVLENMRDLAASLIDRARYAERNSERLEAAINGGAREANAAQCTRLVAA